MKIIRKNSELRIISDEGDTVCSHGVDLDDECADCLENCDSWGELVDEEEYEY